MKKIFFGRKTGHQRLSFWHPWTFGGCLWRIIVFLALLMLLLFLLCLFRRCDDRPYDNGTGTRVPNELREMDDQPIVPLPDDDMPARQGITPIDERDIIEDDSTHQRLAGNALNVIINDSAASEATMQKWEQEFKQLYPADAYKVTYRNPQTMLLQIQVPPAERVQIKNELPQKITDIKFKVFDEAVFTMDMQPKDKIFEYAELSWFYKPIQAQEAWDITMGTPNVTVAVVDSYFDLYHPDLNSDRIVKPYSVRNGNSNVAVADDCPKIDPDPEHGGCIYAPYEHGSMVASLAIGNANNGAAMCGIAPKCKFMPVSVGHQFTMLSLLEGILYAVNQGADVVNVSAGQSFGRGVENVPLDQQIQYAQQTGKDMEDVWDYVFGMADERNVTIVWAAGNEAIYSGMDASKRGKNTVRVAALDTNLRMAYFSDFGNIAERRIYDSNVSAPGVRILGAMPNKNFDIGEGTSFSAPIVTGAIALMKSVNPSLTNEQILSILKTTGKPVPNGSKIGPMLQIKNAVMAARRTTETPSPASPRGGAA